MTGLDEQLARQIDDALRMGSFDGALPGTPEALRQLSTLAKEYLGQAVPSEIRPLASEVAALAKTGALDADEETRFRSALINLRDSLDKQKQLELTTSQLSDDPELVQEFLVESREHLASVEAGVLALEREPENADRSRALWKAVAFTRRHRSDPALRR